ncbi:Ig-like domain-containing protein [Candidatus Gottesmanbacteria bacterium]|nr:Ig-like domain-containing protein [Candidatus Gottesmanbacteria bacterium]
MKNLFQSFLSKITKVLSLPGQSTSSEKNPENYTQTQGKFSKLIQYFENKFLSFLSYTKKQIGTVEKNGIIWFQDLVQANSQKRWLMLRKPLFIVVAILLIIKFGNLFMPPKIMTSFPGNQSAEVPLDSRVEIIFDRGMIRSLVEKSFTITPNISGTISWESDQKFIFTPKNNLVRASNYKVIFQGIILSKFLVPVLGNKTVTFDTIGNPKVVLASPQNEALEDRSPITVVFDRQMVALTTATNSAIKKPAFTVVPEIKGEGRWLGTTAYQFRPAERYNQATTYKVTIPAGLRSADGGLLQDEYSWEFSSERPKIIDVTPKHDYSYASPIASVSATFNQDIDPSSLVDKFILYDKNKNKVPGRTLVSGQVIGFYPTQPLTREDSYEAVAKRGIRSIEGPNGLEDDYSWSFTTAAKPAVVSTIPANGDQIVIEQYHIDVYFKTPMDEESFKDNVFISPQPDGKPSVSFSSYNGKNSLSIGTYLGRSTDYTITIGSGVKDQYGVPLGNPYKFKFQTTPYKPSITINPPGTYFGAFNQQVIPRVVVQVINSNKVGYSLYKLKREDLLDLYRRRYEQQCGSDNACRNWQNYDLSKLEKVKDWSESYESNFNTPVQVITKVTANHGDKLPSGFYFLDIHIEQGTQRIHVEQGIHDNMVMIVTQSTLTVKKSDKQIFVWGVDQSTGEVVSNMKVQLTDTGGNILAEGNTNNDGVFMKDADLFQRNNLFVFGQKDNDLVVSSDIWNNGINLYDFGLPNYYNSNESKDYYTKETYKLFITLDRPIYRPGHKVNYKGVIRKDSDGAYESIRPGERVIVKISDARNRSVYTKELPITTFGSFSGDFVLSKDADLGDYQTSVSYGGSTYTQQFQVEEYKKPDLAISVKSSKDAYVHGENASVAINASYYFGAPVTDAPVTWTLQTQDNSFRWDKDWRFEFGDPDSYWSRPWWYYSGQSYFSGKKVTEGKGTTNAKGDLELTLPLDISTQKVSQKMVLEATVNDISNQSVAASEEFTVHKGELYAGLRPVSYGNQSGKETSVEVVTVDLKGKEAANIPVAIEFYKRSWETIREKNPDDGLFYYTSKPNDSLVSKTSVTTNSLGRGIASFTPTEGGTYKVVSKVSDKNGNINVSGSFLWVSGFGFQTARENNDRIVVVTDKRDYLVGEKMSVFVASPYASDSAKTLLTAERGSVLDYKVVNTSDLSNNFTIPVLPKFTPNAFIGAVLVRPGDQVKKPAEFKMGYTEIKVTDKKQQIDLRISTDKKRYQPKDTMKVTIETKDLLGHPISSELAVGLVDKAVWDLSRVELPDIYKTFYQPRNLEVSTSQLLTISIDRINANTNLGSKGGSGGGGGGGNDTSRRDFPDTAYWNPHLTTDLNGKAEIEIKLPDNLTTWRLAAIANTTESAFGSNVSEVIVSRDVLIRPLIPRFLSVGDEAKLGAIVVNTSGESQTLKATIEAEGLQILDENIKTQTLADGAQAKFSWKTRTNDTKLAKIKLTVEDANKVVKDGLELTLPVKSYSIPEVVATSGEAKDTAQEKIVLPNEIDTTQGKADVSFSPSLGSGSMEALPYLFDYPYYCTEQITSRFMPAVFVHRIFTSAKIDKTGSLDTQQLSAVINDTIQRLNNQQHSDGGWGWWMEYQSDPFITAYAFLGLSEAKKDKFTVADQTLQRSQDYLKQQLASGAKTMPLDTQAYIIYVLRESGGNFSSYAANLYERRFELSLEGRAYLAMAMKNMSGMGSRASRIMAELISLGKKTATTTHWEEAKYNYQFMGSNTTATASVMEALVLFDKNNPLIPEVIRYLMSTRVDNHWMGTRGTASVIKAIASELLTKGDQKVNEDYRLELNGKILKEGKLTKDDLLKLEDYAISISALNIGNENQLRITKSGEGNLYYNINLKYYLPFSEIKPLEQGMVVIREFVDSKGKILPSDSINENTEAWVRLIIVAPEERHFVAIEDVLPAGLESVNESLKNVSTLNKENPSVKEKGNKILYFEHKEYHDDRTTLFASYLSPGVYEVTYRVRATTPGRYHHPPAQAYQMYVPDISGHSDGGWLEVKETK